jgi:hypothetical protein
MHVTEFEEAPAVFMKLSYLGLDLVLVDKLHALFSGLDARNQTAGDRSGREIAQATENNSSSARRYGIRDPKD